MTTSTRVVRLFTSGTLSIEPPSSSWQPLSYIHTKRKSWPLSCEAGPSTPIKQEEVIDISSDEDIKDDRDKTPLCKALNFDDISDISSHALVVSLEQHDRLRRIGRIPSSSSYCFISMYGQVEQFKVEPSLRLLPSRTKSSRDVIDDACLVSIGTSNMIVSGRVRDVKQMCGIMVGESTCVPPKFDRPLDMVKKGGVSSLTTMIEPLTVASGGYDHLVHLWKIKADLSSTAAQALSIKHNSVIQALLSTQDTSHKLISGGADCILNVFDLPSERTIHTLKTSTSIYNLHELSSPFCTLVEVAHRELQYEIRDYRSVPERPVVRFGYDCQQVAGRFIRGALLENMYACGDRQGRVRVWDIRNTDQTLHDNMCMQGQKVVQVVFHESSKLLACTSNHVILCTL